MHREIDKIIQFFWNQINNKQKVSDNPLFYRRVYAFSIEEKNAVAIEGSISDLCNAIVFKYLYYLGVPYHPPKNIKQYVSDLVESQIIRAIRTKSLYQSDNIYSVLTSLNYEEWIEIGERKIGRM